jgi:hypothetical protein
MKKESLKIVLSVSILFGVLATTSAQILYEEDWGTTNGGTSITGVGWQVAIPASGGAGGGPYSGLFPAASPSDYASGAPLGSHTAYVSHLATAQNSFVYTVAGDGAGSGGDSSFSAISQTAETPLIFNLELWGATDEPVYFAVQVGGTWYVSTTELLTFTPAYPVFFNACMNFTTSGTAWNTMTINSNNSGVTITAGAVSVPTNGSITGVGIVQLGNSSDTAGVDYNKFVISSTCSAGPFTAVSIPSTPVSQTVYVGGGAQFVVAASGTLPITYAWYGPNGLITNVSGRFAGATTSELTIFTAQDSDAGSYYVVASNGQGADASTATSSDFTLTVTDPVPSGVLYAETFPWLGPAGYNNLSTTNVGWISAANSGAWSMYPIADGTGAVYCYAGGGVTSAFYTTTATDTGSNGLPFVAINPGSYTYVALEAQVQPSGITGDEAYFAVQMTSGGASNWYVASSPMVFNGSASQSEWLQFNAAASGWNNLTMNATNATIGSAASSALSGNITGVGVVFYQGSTEGTFNLFGVEVTDTQVVQGPQIGASGMPLSQEVLSGAGVSFNLGVSGGTLPYTYKWYLNGSATPLSNGALPDGAMVSGATTALLTITNVTIAENGDTLEAVVTDADSLSDNTGNWSPYTIALAVSDAPIGQIYTETFLYVGPTGNENVTNVGWTEAAPSGSALGLYNNNVGELNNDGYSMGAVSAYQSSAVTTAYYTSTATATGLSGTPFPNIVLSGYTNVGTGLIFTCEIGENATSAGPVTAYWAVQINGSAWYVNTTPLAALTAGAAWTYPVLYFDPGKANWDSLTISATNATIGAPAANDLAGVMTGAGLVFAYGFGGGEDDFDNFWIAGTGVGSIDYSVKGSTLNLSWVGNPYVQLQSTTNLANSGNWVNVSPSTLGKYGTTVTTTGGPKFYQLVGPLADE